jgi:benzoyl-CoA reductase/2-hydroxyglutaryl-CoA dehydratase subunit BcrC/BadD/HgdB
MHVFFTSPWLPAEWIKAHGLEPRGVWFAEHFARQSLPLAAGVCAFANAAIHLAETHPDSAVVFTTHCDQLRRGFDAARGPAPARTFLFNLPATWQSAAAEHIFMAELERLGRFLVSLGGHAPSPEELRRVLTEYASNRNRLLEAASGLPARQYAEAIARFHWDGSVEVAPGPERGGPQPQRSRASTLPAIPLALLGGPLPRSQWALLDTLEHAGGRIVLNATEAGERSLWTSPDLKPHSDDTVAALLGQLARNYLGHCVDVYQRPNTRLYDWLRERLQPRGVRGLVVWHYVGCDLWRAEVQSLREAFGLPVLLLDAAAAAEDSPRNAGRLEAFLEALR